MRATLAPCADKRRGANRAVDSPSDDQHVEDAVAELSRLLSRSFQDELLVLVAIG